MPNAGREDAMIAAVFRTGDVFFGNGKIVFFPTAQTKFVSARVQVRERKVYLKVDARAHYGAVLRVLEGARSAGIENIAFLVRKGSIPER